MLHSAIGPGSKLDLGPRGVFPGSKDFKLSIDNRLDLLLERLRLSCISGILSIVMEEAKLHFSLEINEVSHLFPVRRILSEGDFTELIPDPLQDPHRFDKTMVFPSHNAQTDGSGAFSFISFAESLSWTLFVVAGGKVAVGGSGAGLDSFFLITGTIDKNLAAIQYRPMPFLLTIMALSLLFLELEVVSPLSTSELIKVGAKYTFFLRISTLFASIFLLCETLFLQPWLSLSILTKC